MSLSSKPVKAGTLRSLGLEEWLNRRYQSSGGFTEWRKLYRHSYSDAAIAEVFQVTYQTANAWRRNYEERNNG